ncbi:hypothetical protein G3578_09865 [Brevibacillus sp. SYP-B805]|uniref:hypothetical protein n=1 Tax=Brevibacillus sp. SYP-B805 TaxID=1578199 RepID=UPI0013EDF5D8|nr:hypothetical protein [Brevibacillus sp. SYP-B805]NGQ95459.1 hypothetical protein [Brevibacillus sp. SYP-B805]
MTTRRNRMANQSTNIGAHSELVAATALLAAGYEVARPLAAESYDLAARDPVTGEWATYQVKTARYRPDRNAYVVYATRTNGEAYTRDDCDYLIGVLDDAVYVIENREIGEYWVSPDNIDAKWRKLTVGIRKETKEAV